MTSIRATAKVVLVGGPLTSDNGSAIDSRQPIIGDDACETIRKSLSTSWLWWTTTISLVMPILEAAGPLAFALLIGERSVVDLRPDGSIKRTGLKGLLPGGAARAHIVRTGMRYNDLPPDFTLADELRAWNGQSLGKIGVKLDGAPNCRWRFLEGNEYYLDKAGSSINPTVIVDTTNVLVGTGSNLQDTVHAEALDKRRFLGSGVALVLPHTHANETVVRTYVEWVAAARPPRPPVPFTLPPPWDPTTPPNPMRYTTPVPIEAQFRVTGLVSDGEWQSPDDLEAARSLLAARFDLKIGIWDLVDNAILRNSLLEKMPIQPAPPTPIQVPKAATQRAEATVATKMVERKQKAEALQTIWQQAYPLRRLGWATTKQPDWLRLPLTEPIQRWTEQDPSPLVFLTLDVGKRQTTVTAGTVMYNQVDLQAYVRTRRLALEQIAGMELPELDKMRPVLWRSTGGWGDTVDWPARFELLAERTSQWAPGLAEFVDSCRQALRRRLAVAQSD